MKITYMLLILAMPFVFSAQTGMYFECYVDCPIPPQGKTLVGCEVNTLSGNLSQFLVDMGTKTPFYYNEFFSSDTYREDVICYYDQAIGNITGISKNSQNRQPKAVNVSFPLQPPQQPNIPLAPGIPVNKVPLKKIVVKKGGVAVNATIHAQNATAQKQRTVTTPDSYPVTHYKCPDDCPPSGDDNLLRCSIIYNFKQKGEYSKIIESPYIEPSKENRSVKYKAWAKEENGKWIYDELIVCEYEILEGAISYTERQTPYDRLGYIAPPSIEDLEKLMKELNDTNTSFSRTEESCEMNGVVLPPEYANIQGDIYAIKENPEDWAFLCLNEYEESESLVTIIQEANQYPMLLEILWGKRTEVEISESSFCIFAPTPEELEISQNCENPDGILFISQEALEHVSSDGLDGFANEWGNGIVYTPNSISAMIQKFTIDVSVFIHSIFG